MASHYYELYRRTSIGIALADALDELITAGQMDPQLALKVLSNVRYPHGGFLIRQFDKAITDELALNVKARMSFKALFLSPIGL
jgi:transcription initiation factor TFIIA small subunit